MSRRGVVGLGGALLPAAVMGVLGGSPSSSGGVGGGAVRGWLIMMMEWGAGTGVGA